MRKDEFKVDGKLPLTLPNRYPIVKSKEPMERIENYEGLLKPTPIEIELRGQLPPFDVDKELNFVPKLIPTKKELEKENFKLMDHISDRDIFRKHIPKQAELDKFIKSMKEKVIHEYNIPITVKELRAEYNNSPYFKDILTYITKGYCRYVGKAQRLFKLSCEDYLVMNGILFRIRYDKGNGGKPSLVLCVPEKYIPTILYQYHSPLLAGHPGTVKLYETLRRKYYFPAMFTVVRQYVSSCLECQSMKPKTEIPNMHYSRVPLDTRVMARMSVDVKSMPYSALGFRHILVCTCEYTNWVEAIPIANEKAQTIAEALYFKIICKYGTPKAVICDEGPAFTSDLMKAYFHSMNIKPYYISPMNHGSNKTERYIRTLNDILCKNLSGVGISWPLFVLPSCWAMNSQVSHVTGFSPYEMVYHQTPPDLFNFDFDPEKTGLKIDTKNYLELMKQRKEIMDKIIISRKKYETESRLVREMRKFPDAHGYAIGDLVMIYHETGSVLHSASKKLKRNWIGPLRIQAILDDTHYLVSDWTGQLLPKRIHFNRLKPYVMNLGKINEEGILETATNTRELFKRWKEIKEDSKYDNRYTQT